MRVRRKALKRLLDALQAIQAIDVFTSGATLEAFLDNELPSLKARIQWAMVASQQS